MSESTRGRGFGAFPGNVYTVRQTETPEPLGALTSGGFPSASSGAVTHLCCIIALLLWEPHPRQLAVFFVFSGLWGVSDAVWQTQNNGERPRVSRLARPWGAGGGRGPRGRGHLGR